MIDLILFKKLMSKVPPAYVYRVGEDVVVIMGLLNTIYVQNLMTGRCRYYRRQDERLFNKFWRYVFYRSRRLTDGKIYSKAIKLGIDCSLTEIMPEILDSYRRTR